MDIEDTPVFSFAVAGLFRSHSSALVCAVNHLERSSTNDRDARAQSKENVARERERDDDDDEK